MKKIYQIPGMRVAELQQKCQLLQASQTGGPTANFMSNPTVSGSVKQESSYDVWKDDWSN